MMDRQEIQKLLGGYATGTLTPEEQQVLFTAALEDQELFDALAREQSLKDLLADPAARGQLLASIEDRPAPWYRRFWRPLAVAAAAAACVVGFGVYVNRPKPQSATVLVAEVKPSEEAPPQAVDKLEPAPAPVQPARASSPKPALIPENAPLRNEPVLADRKKPAASPPPPPPPQPVPAAAPAVAQPAGLAGAPQGGAIAAEAPKEMAKKAEVQLDSTLQTAASGGAQLKDQAAALAEQKVQIRDAVNKSISLQSAQALFSASQQSFDQNALARQYFAPQRQEEQKQQAGNKQQQQQQALEKLQAIAPLAGQNLPVAAGVKWTVLRRRDGGDFVEVEPDQLRVGDSVKLRLTPNVDGYLTVWEGSQSMMREMHVERLKQFETPIVAPSQPGQKTVTVQLTRIAPGYVTRIQNVSGQQSVSDSAAHATYVLNTTPLAPVQAVIPLQFR